MSRQMMHFGLLMLATLATFQLPQPGVVISVVLVVAAIVVGVRAIVIASRAQIRGALVPMLAVGVALASLFFVSVLTALLAWPQTQTFQECAQDALTESAKAECEELNPRTHPLVGRTSPTG